MPDKNNQEQPVMDTAQDTSMTTADGTRVTADGTTTTLERKTPETTTSIDDYKFEGGDWSDILDYMQKRKDALANKIPSDEDLKKEARRKRTEGIIAALSDSASAISNLITTTHYAPNIYNPEQSMTGKWQERYEKIKKEHDEQNKEYYDLAMNIAKIKDSQALREYQQARDKYNDETARIKAASADTIARIKAQVDLGKLSILEAAQKLKEESAETDRRLKEARTRQADASANRANRGGSGGGSGRGGSGKGKWDVEETTEYERDAMGNVKGKKTQKTYTPAGSKKKSAKGQVKL